MPVKKEFNKEFNVFLEDNEKTTHCFCVRTTSNFDNDVFEIILTEFKGKGNKITFQINKRDLSNMIEFLASQLNIL